MSLDIEVDDHAASIVALLIPHDAGLASVPFTDLNSLENFFPQGDLNQCASRGAEPRHVTTVWDTYSIMINLL